MQWSGRQPDQRRANAQHLAQRSVVSGLVGDPRSWSADFKQEVRKQDHNRRSDAGGFIGARLRSLIESEEECLAFGDEWEDGSPSEYAPPVSMSREAHRYSRDFGAYQSGIEVTERSRDMGNAAAADVARKRILELTSSAFQTGDKYHGYLEEDDERNIRSPEVRGKHLWRSSIEFEPEVKTTSTRRASGVPDYPSPYSSHYESSARADPISGQRSLDAFQSDPIYKKSLGTVIPKSEPGRGLFGNSNGDWGRDQQNGSGIEAQRSLGNFSGETRLKDSGQMPGAAFQSRTEEYVQHGDWYENPNYDEETGQFDLFCHSFLG
jgi:hypothetical protein